MRNPKPFVQKPNQPGATVTWTHVLADGVTTVERTGEVWAEAHGGPRMARGLWVIPEQPLPGDLYTALPVLFVTAQTVTVGKHTFVKGALVGTEVTFTRQWAMATLAGAAAAKARAANAAAATPAALAA